MRTLTDTEAEALGEDSRGGNALVTGPLWPDAHAVTWPRSGGGGTCSHHAPDSCSYCDGSEADTREVDMARWAAKRSEASR